MKKLIKSKKLVFLVLLILIIVIAVPSSVYAYNNYNFNKLYSSGLELLNKENFDEAISAFNNSLKFKPKKKDLIEGKVTMAKTLKDSKTTFDLGVSLQNEKKYLDALDAFKKIKNEDTKRYGEAQDKIKQCKDNYINQNLDNAKNEASNKKYSEAIAYLDTLLKFDEGNKDAQTLKDEYNNNIKKIADEAEKAKKEEEAKLAAEKAKKEEANKLTAQNAAKTKSAPSTTSKAKSTSTSAPKTASTNNDVISNQNLFIVLKGSDPILGRMLSLREARVDPQPFHLAFAVDDAGFDHPVDYDITFYLVGRTAKYSGKTSMDRVGMDVSSSEVPSRENIKIVIDFKVDGKVYTTSGYRVLNPY